MTSYPDRPAVAFAVTGVLSARFGGAYASLDPETTLGSLGLDSVDVLDALAALEGHFSILLQPDDLEELESLQDLIDLVCRKIGLPGGA